MQVLICEIETAYSNLPEVVAVRSAQDSYVDREDFLRESRLVSSIQHPNVVRLLGVCTVDQPYCTILEHSRLGNLYTYLNTNCNPESDSFTTVPFNKLLDILGQIVSGMKHLESRSICHKDLAAR